MIIWLASYPKSGNTWVRMFLNSILFSNNNVDINKNKIRSFPLRNDFDTLNINVDNVKEFAENCLNAQDLINAVISVDQNLLSNVKVFDVYEGNNIPENQKSIAISVTIQSTEKTLNDNDLEQINKLIIKTVENKTGAKIRS